MLWIGRGLAADADGGAGKLESRLGGRAEGGKEEGSAAFWTGCSVVALERVEMRWETGGMAGRRDLRVRKRRILLVLFLVLLSCEGGSLSFFWDFGFWVWIRAEGEAWVLGWWGRERCGSGSARCPASFLRACA